MGLEYGWELGGSLSSAVPNEAGGDGGASGAPGRPLRLTGGDEIGGRRVVGRCSS